MLNPNLAAFPGPISENGMGLTKREFFAALAMCAQIQAQETAYNQDLIGDPLRVRHEMAEHALLYADALIAELNRQQGEQH